MNYKCLFLFGVGELAELGSAMWHRGLAYFLHKLIENFFKKNENCWLK